jgi:membrane protein
MWKSGWQLIKNVANAWSNDNIASMGAALAYYTVFSLAPLLLILVTIAGLAFGNDVAQNAMLQEFSRLIGANGAEAIRVILNGAQSSHDGAISLAIGGATLFVGATTVVAELQRDIDIIWKTPKLQARANGLFGLLKVRLLSFTLIIGVGFLLIVSLAISAVISALSTLWGDWLKGIEIALQIINVIVSIMIFTLLFAFIYKLLPSVPIAWRDVWLGALVTASLFSFGKFIIGLYIGKSAIASSFGAAGAFVVLIVWVYYSAQIFLLGAEFTYAYGCAHGSRCPLVVTNDDAIVTDGKASSKKS